MRQSHSIATFLFLALSVYILGSGSYEISLRNSDLLSPVADVAYDWKALDHRLKTLRPTPVPVVRVANSRITSVPTRAEMESYVEEKFGPHAERAKAIVSCESNWNPKAVNTSNRNGSNDKGLWQINSIHKVPDSCRLDPKCATDWAKRLFDRQGWKPWVCNKLV